MSAVVQPSVASCIQGWNLCLFSAWNLWELPPEPNSSQVLQENVSQCCLGDVTVLIIINIY